MFIRYLVHCTLLMLALGACSKEPDPSPTAPVVPADRFSERPPSVLDGAVSTKAEALPGSKARTKATFRTVDSSDIVQQLVHDFAHGHRAAADTIQSLGPDLQRAVDLLATPTAAEGVREVVRELHGRAASKGKIEGERFLELMARDAARRNAGFAAQLGALQLGRMSAEELAKPVQFATEPAAAVPPEHEERIRRLADAFSESRASALKRLAEIGFQAQVEELARLDGCRMMASFAPDTLIETLYRQANAAGADHGDRFLARLYHSAESQSAAIATDADFAPLRRFSSEQLAVPIEFRKPGSVVGEMAELSQPVQRGIDKLAEVLSGPHLGRARVHMLQNLQNPRFTAKTFEEVLLRSRTRTEALREMLRLGTPPPTPEKALFQIFHGMAGESAAAAIDPETRRIMFDLSEKLPPELNRYARGEDDLTSRKRQYEQADSVRRPRKAPAFNGKHVAFAEIPDQPDGDLRREGGPGRNREEAGPSAKPSPEDQAPTSGGNSGGGGGGASGGGGRKGDASGPHGPTPRPGSPPAGPGSAAAPPKPSWGVREASVQRSAVPYNAYARSTFQGVNAVPRSYSSARISARAARGVAVGGQVTSRTGETPRAAYWIPNAQDYRFGRLFIHWKGQDKPVCVTKTMFADSFFAAASVVFDEHKDECRFQDGELLILMSMNPDADWVPTGSEIAAKAEEIQKRYVQLVLTGELTPEKEKVIEQEIEALGNLPRGIVVHPATAGRELAWSTARVDFWLNDLKLVEEEAKVMTGGTGFPDAFHEIDLTDAATWQYYELDAKLELGSSKGGVQDLIVSSAAPSGTDTHASSHFGITMFTVTDEAPAGSVPVSGDANTHRLPRLEKELQPLFDWLSTRHHDFVRLNHFSETFSILRWLSGFEIEILALMPVEDRHDLPTPDRVVIGEGPQVQPRK